MKNFTLTNFLSYLFAIILFALVISQNHPSFKLNLENPKIEPSLCCQKENSSKNETSYKKTLEFFASSLDLKISSFKKENLLKFSLPKPKNKNKKRKNLDQSSKLSQATLLSKFNSFDLKKPKSKIEITAQSALAIEPQTNFVFYQKNPKKLLPLASITKLMTSFVALKYFPENLILEVPSEIEKIESAHGKLKPKDKFFLKDLIYLMLMVSSNQAAYTLQKNLNLLPLMNLEAKKIGLEDTFFEDASGLSEKNLSSAKDVARLTYYIFQHQPLIFEIQKTKEITLRSLEGNLYHLKNNNPFVNFPNFLGGKTGWFSAEIQNLVSIFKLKNKKMVIIVVLGSRARFEDVKKILNLIEKQN